MKKNIVTCFAFISLLVFVAQPVQAACSLNMGFDWGFGKMKNSSETIQSRTMNALSFHVLPAYSLGVVSVGPQIEYRIVGQNTAAADVANTNLKGSGYLLGVAAFTKWMDLTVGLGFSFYGQHKLSLADIGGNESTYKKPIGFNLSVGYPVAPSVTADLRASLVSYRESNVGSVVSDVSDNKLTHWNIGLGAAYHW